MPGPIINDPRTKQADKEVRRLLHLIEMMDKLPDAFNDVANVTRSYVEAANVPARIQQTKGIASEAQPREKRGRP